MKYVGALFSICFCVLGCLLWIVALLIVIVGALGILRITVDNVFETNSIEIAKRLQMKGLLEGRKKNVPKQEQERL